MKMRELILELEQQIKVTEDVTELKKLQSQHEKLVAAAAREDELTAQIESLTNEHNSLKNDYIKAVRHSVVGDKEAPKSDEPKTDEEIFNEWKESVIK